MEAHIKEHPAWFHRFDATWTPTVLVLDPKGVERYRIEGYLPKTDFRAELEMALGRIAFKAMRWPDAERIYSGIAQNFSASNAAPGALYWSAVSHYKGTGDHTALGRVAQELSQKYPQSEWAKKASPWGA